MPRVDDTTPTLRRVLKRSRNAAAGCLRLTSAESRAVQNELLPAAIRYAQAHGRRLPRFASLCGCRVFVWVNMAGQVGVAADQAAAPLAMSAPWRA